MNYRIFNILMAMLFLFMEKGYCDCFKNLQPFIQAYKKQKTTVEEFKNYSPLLIAGEWLFNYQDKAGKWYIVFSAHYKSGEDLAKNQYLNDPDKGEDRKEALKDDLAAWSDHFEPTHDLNSNNIFTLSLPIQSVKGTFKIENFPDEFKDRDDKRVKNEFKDLKDIFDKILLGRYYVLLGDQAVLYNNPVTPKRETYQLNEKEEDTCLFKVKSLINKDDTDDVHYIKY